MYDEDILKNDIKRDKIIRDKIDLFLKRDDLSSFSELIRETIFYIEKNGMFNRQGLFEIEKLKELLNELFIIK
jgi:hypothetical protein